MNTNKRILQVLKTRPENITEKDYLDMKELGIQIDAVSDESEQGYVTLKMNDRSLVISKTSHTGRTALFNPNYIICEDYRNFNKVDFMNYFTKTKYPQLRRPWRTKYQAYHDFKKRAKDYEDTIQRRREQLEKELEFFKRRATEYHDLALEALEAQDA